MTDWKAERRMALLEHIQQETVLGPSGELRWLSNGAVVPLDIFAEAGIAPPDAQEAARKIEVDAFLAEYRRQRTGRSRSAEEFAEMRAAFGHGAKVVDVITGESVTL